MSKATWTLPMEALCGSRFPNCQGRGRLRMDPYEQDVYGRKVLRYLCDACTDAIGDEI